MSLQNNRIYRLGISYSLQSKLEELKFTGLVMNSRYKYSAKSIEIPFWYYYYYHNPFRRAKEQATYPKQIYFFLGPSYINVFDNYLSKDSKFYFDLATKNNLSFSFGSGINAYIFKDILAISFRIRVYGQFFNEYKRINSTDRKLLLEQFDFEYKNRRKIGVLFNVGVWSDLFSTKHYKKEDKAGYY